MTEVKSDEASLFTKRKSDLVSLDKDDTPEKLDDVINKKHKADVSSTDNIDPLNCEAEENKNVNGEEQTSIHGDNERKDVDEEEDDDEDDDEEVYEDDDEEEEDSEDDHSNGKAGMVDRKGKGIMMDDKGKGKMIEESEDSSEFGSDSDGDGDGDGDRDRDSDLSDDPLAEVDLDNILPTRTRSRSRVVQPGIRMSDDQGSKREDGDN